jgi:hypothetical protein
VTGVTFNSAGLGIVASTNTWQTDKDINDAIGKLKTALSTLQTQTSVFSSNQSLVDARQGFTNSMIDTLQTASDNLVTADSNEEAAARPADPAGAVDDRAVDRRLQRSIDPASVPPIARKRLCKRRDESRAVDSGEAKASHFLLGDFPA